jgi:hypothetical protein|tara:strand:- start:1631 stop:1999 length:369 start_codon:yes stop_codon:yes gene_type:complete
MIEFRGLREGIRWEYPRDEMIFALKMIASYAAKKGITVRITSMNDHRHSATSLHKEDLAVDMQILKKDGTVWKAEMDRLVRYLRETLPGSAWDLVWRKPSHHNHIHLEHDTRQRKTPNAQGQ